MKYLLLSLLLITSACSIKHAPKFKIGTCLLHVGYRPLETWEKNMSPTYIIRDLGKYSYKAEWVEYKTRTLEYRSIEYSYEDQYQPVNCGEIK